MISHSRSPKSKNSAIRYWWIPLDLQSFESENICQKENSERQTVSRAESKAKSEINTFSNRINTTKFVSVIGEIWNYVGEPESFQTSPAVFQTKEGLKYDGVLHKDNAICFSGSQRKGTATPVNNKCFFYDLQSRNCPSSTRSHFEHLNAFKKMLLFASCNISNSFTCRDADTSNRACNADSTGVTKLASIGITNDLKKAYGMIRWKPFLNLNGLVKISGSESIIRTAENSILGKEKPPSEVSATITAETNVITAEIDVITESKPASAEKTDSAVENMLEPNSYIESSFSFVPIKSMKEAIVVLRSLTSGLELDDTSAASPPIDVTVGGCQDVKESCFAVVESLEEVLATSDQNNTESSQRLFQELDFKQRHSSKDWLLMQDKIQHAFAKNKHAIAGALAGTLVSLCLHPVDTIKTVIQSNQMAEKSCCDIVRTIISEKGVMGLYRGIASHIASSAPISAIYTFTYESVKGALLPLLPKEYHSFAHCAAGGCSSIATSFIYTPSECIKQQMQVGLQYQNCWNALIGCLEKGGLSSLYAGWGAVLCRNIPHSIIKFYTYERLKQFILSSAEPDANLNTLQTLVCGGLAGSTAALFTNPFDVVKTRLQTQAPGSLGQYSGVFHTLQEIARQEGLQGLYRGLTPRLAMYVSQGAIFFASYEFLKALFSLEVPRAPTPLLENMQEDDAAPQRIQKLHA